MPVRTGTLTPRCQYCHEVLDHVNAVRWKKVIFPVTATHDDAPVQSLATTHLHTGEEQVLEEYSQINKIHHECPHCHAGLGSNIDVMKHLLNPLILIEKKKYDRQLNGIYDYYTRQGILLSSVNFTQGSTTYTVEVIDENNRIQRQLRNIADHSLISSGRPPSSRARVRAVRRPVQQTGYVIPNNVIDADEVAIQIDWGNGRAERSEDANDR